MTQAEMDHWYVVVCDVATEMQYTDEYEACEFFCQWADAIYEAAGKPDRYPYSGF